MARDLRPPLTPATDAFGVPITVTRPAPENTPVATTGIWQAAPLLEEPPYGQDLQRRDPRRVMAIPRDTVLTHIPRGSVIVAPEQLGGTARTWHVDGLERMAADEMRVILAAA
jgi:hypothetical protein